MNEALRLLTFVHALLLRNALQHRNLLATVCTFIVHGRLIAMVKPSCGLKPLA